MNSRSSIEHQKNQIRQEIRRLRQSIDKSSSYSSALSAIDLLKTEAEFSNACYVACFLSFDGEIDTNPIIQEIIEAGKICLLPYLKPYKPNRLWFMPYTPGEAMIKNRYGIPEVDKKPSEAVRISKIDLILLPLVAFDVEGNRLGMGGGFYDATLSHLNEPEFKNTRPDCFGLAFEKQKVKSIPTEKWDYPIDAVVTEKTIYRF